MDDKEVNMIPKFLKDYKPNSKNPDYCVVCDKKLKGKLHWIGININTGKYTYDIDLATQGWFTIGADCKKKINKDSILRKDII